MVQTQPTANVIGHDIRALVKMVIPIYTTAQRNAIVNPITGEEIFNSDTIQFEYWDGAAWVAVASTINYWQRAGIIVSPKTAGDSISLGTGILRNTAYASLIDANAKFLPVEILGTNIGTGGLFNTTGIRLFGQAGANRNNLMLDQVGDNHIFIQRYTNVTGGDVFLTASRLGGTGYPANFFGFGTISHFSCIGVSAGLAGIWQNQGEVFVYHRTGNYHNCNAELRMNNNNVTIGANYVFDGLDLSVYGLAYVLNCEICNVTAPGTDPIAGDVDKEVLDDGVGVGWLRDYRAGYWLIELYTPGTIIANGSVLTITAGSAASKTTTGAGTVAPRLSQTTKPHMGKCKIGAGGTVTIYLDDIGDGSGNILYGKGPYIVASYQDNGAAGVIPVDVTVAANRKSAVITGDVNKYVVWVSISDV